MNKDTMMYFSARYSALIDDKGRVVLPAPFKRTMGELAEEPLVIEKDIYKSCLNIYPERTYHERLANIQKNLNEHNEFDRDLMAQLNENFVTITMALNGRINIPSEFMKHAEIDEEVREVIFIGNGPFITLWKEKVYEEVRQKRKPLREMYSERLGNVRLGF